MRHSEAPVGRPFVSRTLIRFVRNGVREEKKRDRWSEAIAYLTALASLALVIGIILLVRPSDPVGQIDPPETIAELRRHSSSIQEVVRELVPGEDVSVTARGDSLHITISDKGWIGLNLKDGRIKSHPDTHGLYGSEVEARRAYLQAVGERIHRRLARVLPSS